MRLLLILFLLVPLSYAAELKPRTKAGFDHYVKVAEARITAEIASAGKNKPFLNVDMEEPAEQKAEHSRLSQGETLIERVDEKENGRSIREIPDGLVHHWRATVFIPGADLKATVALIQDYAHHKDVYKPEVIDSRLISKTPGGEYRAYLRFYKKKIIGVTLDTEHLAQYLAVSPTREYSYSHTTRIAEVDDAGTPKEHEKPVGNDSGFMWALNSYWRLEQKDGGTYVQCEAISLTRDIPTGLGWIVKPFITDVPKESLHTTLDQTRAWLMRKR